MEQIKYIILAMTLSVMSVLTAQNNQNQTKVDEMHIKKWQFITEKVPLTNEEIDKVQPIFMAYEKSVWDQHAKNREYFRQARRNKEGKDKPNYAELNERYVDLELIQAQLFKSYHLKLKKILPAETLFNFYGAERDFKKKLLQDFHSGKGNRN